MLCIFSVQGNSNYNYNKIAIYIYIVGILVRPQPATARLNLLFLDSSAEQDPGASGRGYLTIEAEISVRSLLCSESGITH